MIDEITKLAATAGFPDRSTDEQRIRFDRDVASAIRGAMDLSWAEAGSRDVWTFVAMVALPHLTFWRFGIGNQERWIASDLTRHTWARLWWQGVIFNGNPDLLNALHESDLNQLLERRSIGGDPRLVCAIARVILEQVDAGGDRRILFRNATLRLRRFLAFADPRSLSDDQQLQMCRDIVAEIAGRTEPGAQAAAPALPQRRGPVPDRPTSVARADTFD
ncbi:hypothetical protein ACFQ1L_01520 [Phytohabitans flavus]|uniref:hypothetical protein n=1 Tax=Phytohabitans flavus TaxID=1076124 RepID=UPI00362B6784